MKAADFDKAFDDGADIDELVDWASAERRNVAIRRVNVDFRPGSSKGWTGKRSFWA